MRRVGRAVEVFSSRDKLVWSVVRGPETFHCFSPAAILKLLRLKALAILVRDLRSFRLLFPILLMAPGLAQAQTAPPPSADIQRERVDQLKELLRTKKDLQKSILTMQQTMQQQLAEFDARIAALEASLGVTPSQDERTQQGNSDATAATAPASTAALASPGGMVSAKASDPALRSGGYPLRKSWGFPTKPL